MIVKQYQRVVMNGNVYRTASYEKQNKQGSTWASDIKLIISTCSNPSAPYHKQKWTPSVRYARIEEMYGHQPWEGADELIFIKQILQTSRQSKASSRTDPVDRGCFDARQSVCDAQGCRSDSCRAVAVVIQKEQVP